MGYTANLINLSTRMDGTAYKEVVDRTQIFVDEKSVARTEFYMAMNSGVRPTYILETRIENYALGEHLVNSETFQADKIEYNGQIYDIIRSYAVDTTKVQLTIGGINRSVKVQSISTSVDAQGQPVETWTDKIECLATIEAVSGREFTQGKASQSEVTHIITIKNRDWVKPDMRVIYGTRTFQVMYMMRNEENLDLKLQCKELFVNG